MIVYYTPAILIPWMKVYMKILICYEYSNKFWILLYSCGIPEPNNIKKDERTRLNEVRATPENTSYIKLDLVDYINECSKEQQQILSTDNRKNQKLVIVPIKVKKTMWRNQG